MEITPLHDRPALLLEGKQRILVLADLHIGFERSLEKSGIHLRSRTNEKLATLKEMVQLCDPDRIILLGDVKHSVFGPPYMEKKEILDFLSGVVELIPSIDIVPGNHDTHLRKYLEDVSGKSRFSKMVYHSSRGTVIEDAGLFHGHTWPEVTLLSSKVLIMGHSHPHVFLPERLGPGTSRSCWLRGTLDHSVVKERYQDTLVESNMEVVVLPAFHSLGGGTFINTKPTQLLGPFLRKGCIDLPSSKVYLTDGTFLGLQKDLLVERHHAPSRIKRWRLVKGGRRRRKSTEK